MLKYFDALDRQGGSGSRSAEEDWLDDNTTAKENQWSTAATTFYVSQAPEYRQRKFQDLYKIHNGWGESDRQNTILDSHIMNDAEAFCDILELPSFQRKRVMNIVEELDFDSNRFGGKPYEKIILAVCSLVSDEELTKKLRGSGGREGSLDERLRSQEEFEHLMDTVGMSRNELSRIRQALRERTDFF